MSAEIRLDDVTVAYGATMALRSVSCCMRPGLTLLEGANGAGKSTLLGVAGGLVRPGAGRVRVLGSDPVRDPLVHRWLGFAPQLAPPPPQLRPLELVVSGARRALPRRQALAAARERMEELGVDPDDERRIGGCPPDVVRLSVVARALVGDPAVVVLDEPLAELSEEQRARVVALLALAARGGQVVVVSSHVVDQLRPVATERLVLAEGRIVDPERCAPVAADAPMGRV